mgnify:CR=1 FL=1
MEKGLDYIFNERTKMIILGTFPSIQSRDSAIFSVFFFDFRKKVCGELVKSRAAITAKNQALRE